MRPNPFENCPPKGASLITRIVDPTDETTIGYVITGIYPENPNNPVSEDNFYVMGDGSAIYTDRIIPGFLATISDYIEWQLRTRTIPMCHWHTSDDAFKFIGRDWKDVSHDSGESAIIDGKSMRCTTTVYYQSDGIFDLRGMMSDILLQNSVDRLRASYFRKKLDKLSYALRVIVQDH